MADTGRLEDFEKFAPKDPPKLSPPKDDLINVHHLAKCDGSNSAYPTWVAIMGTVFDVSGNTAYAPEKPYNVFAGKDASRALAQSSLEPKDCRSEWEDLSEKEKVVLNDWFTFFSKRYNIVGKVQQEA